MDTKLYRPDYTDFPKIKEIVDWLNGSYPSVDDDSMNTFVAVWQYHPLMRWHIICKDYWVYFESSTKERSTKHTKSNEDLRLCIEATEIKYPELRPIYCYQYYLGVYSMLRNLKCKGEPIIIIGGTKFK